MLSRRTFVASLAAVAAGATSAAAQGASPTAHIWAGLDLVDTAGQSFRLASLQPKLKLVTMWAHWCAGCLIEMPSLVALEQTVGRNNLQIVLVSNNEDFRRDQATAERLRLPFRLATPSPDNRPELVRAALLDRDGAYVVPRTLLFAGAENALVSQLTGSRDWSAQAAQLRALG